MSTSTSTAHQSTARLLKTTTDTCGELHCFVSAKLMSPVLAPPGHVAVYACPPVQTASADLMHCSQRPLEMLMVAPEDVGFSVNLASPDAPVVEVGLPWHFVMEPEMPPQMASRATFLLCVSMFLERRLCQYLDILEGNPRNGPESTCGGGGGVEWPVEWE